MAEREVPDTAQDLYRLDGGDHSARDRPLRGDFDMILYFTGTGNSGYIAQRIAEALGD